MIGQQPGPHRLEMAAQSRHRRHGGPLRPAARETGHRLIHDGPGGSGGGLARGAAFQGDPFQIGQIVDEGAFQTAHRRIDVAGDGGIDHEDGTAAAFLRITASIWSADRI